MVRSLRPALPCSTACDGGDPWAAIAHVVDSGGIATLADYQYEGLDNYCRANRTRKVGRFKVSWPGREATGNSCQCYESGLSSKGDAVCIHMLEPPLHISCPASRYGSAHCVPSTCRAGRARPATTTPH